MKNFQFLILVFVLNVAVAEKVDTNQSAALVNPKVQSPWEQQQQGLVAVLSGKSGLSLKTIKNKFNIDESFKSVILRDYYEQVPTDVSADLQWYNLAVDEAKLQQLMLAQRIPIWPDRRGQVYVWLVEESADNELSNANVDSQAVYWLERWFRAMAIPVEFYNSDAADLLMFEPKDVRYLNPDLIDHLLLNEDMASVLLVFVKDTGSGYSYRYGLSQVDKQTSIKNLQFLDLASGMLTLASDIQKTLAEGHRLYPDEFNPSTVSLIVNDINTADQMLRLMDYLDEHALIDRYLINQAKGQQVQLMAELKVLPDTFIGFVENEGFLRHQPINVGSSILFKVIE